jgi:hypothetical protein
MSYKLDKYFHKFVSEPSEKYIHKITYYLAKHGVHMHNNVQLGGDLKLGNLDSLLTYIREHVEPVQEYTKRKYCVILYGPPASGKSFARKLAVSYIKKHYENKLEPDTIAKTFIDTEVDSIVSDIDIDGTNVKETMLTKTKNVINPFPDAIIEDDMDRQTKINLAKDRINELIKETEPIYWKYRKDGDKVSELFYYISAFLNYNLFIEIATPQETYIKNTIFNFCKYYNYVPIIIYPFIQNVNTLCERMYTRGITEGRFIHCRNEKTNIQSIMNDDLAFYNKLKQITDENNDNYMSLMYNADIPRDVYTHIKNTYDISNFTPYVLEFHKKEKEMYKHPEFVTKTTIINN